VRLAQTVLPLLTGILFDARDSVRAAAGKAATFVPKNHPLSDGFFLLLLYRNRRRHEPRFLQCVEECSFTQEDPSGSCRGNVDELQQGITLSEQRQRDPRRGYDSDPT